MDRIIYCSFFFFRGRFSKRGNSGECQISALQSFMLCGLWLLCIGVDQTRRVDTLRYGLVSKSIDLCLTSQSPRTRISALSNQSYLFARKSLIN